MVDHATAHRLTFQLHRAILKRNASRRMLGLMGRFGLLEVTGPPVINEYSDPADNPDILAVYSS
jgi:hypothetical protein